MKKILPILILNFSFLFSFAQAPHGFNYQAVARNSSGAALTNQAIGLQISLLQGSANGTVVYTETHSVTSNNLGLLNIVVGNGTPTAGTFNTINWANGPYFIEISMDVTGGAAYSLMGTQQLMSVPYALYAQNSGTAGTQGATGGTGFSGNNGLIGATGAPGLIGATGTNGNNGATGSTGSAGTNGINGITGTTGSIGYTGVSGTNGINGTTGTTGSIGYTGGSGANGIIGITGSTGYTGGSGTNGTNGINGITGFTGTIGSTGTNGINGVTGGTGVVGATGASNGLTGGTGAKGATGATGTTGDIGATGAGTTGATGAIGATGASNGSTGAIGATGNTGNAGAMGSTGASGVSVPGTLCGAAATNYIPKLTSNTTMCNSIIYDNGTNVGINTGTTPAASAALDVTSTNLGLLVPRMTVTQRNAITSPANSLLIFNTTSNCYEWWDALGSNWVSMSCGCQAPATPTANAASSQTATSFAANWTASSGATAYFLDVSTVNTFSTFVTGYNDLNVGNVVTKSVTGLTCGTYYYRVRAYKICGTSSSSNVITIITNPSSAPSQPSVITGTPTLCQGVSGLAYSVTNVSGITYTWTYSGTGFTCASGCTTNAVTANFSASATSGTLTVTPNNGCGNGPAQTYSITVSPIPTTAAAGTDIYPACGVTTAVLAGNTPSVGTGLWSVASGTASITAPTSPTSGITGLSAADPAILKWTITNGGCTSNDVVVVYPTSCTAGPICGTQEWAAKNVNVGLMINSSAGGTFQTNNGLIEKYCYNNLASNCVIYGGMYEWNEAMNYAATSTCNPCGSGGVQGICPAGYHIPTDLEYSNYEYCLESTVSPTGSTALIDFQGLGGYRGSTTLGIGPGSKMKASSGDNPAWDGTNTSGFAALPGGERYYNDGLFYFAGNTGNAYYWTSTESSGSNAWYRGFVAGGAQGNRSGQNKAGGHSVRCIKN